MKQQMLWKRIRPVYMAPQYTSTSHFLTQHSLSGQTVCVPEGGSGVLRRGAYVLSPKRASVQSDRPVWFSVFWEVLWNPMSSVCERSFSLHREVFSAVWHPVNHQREQLLFGIIYDCRSPRFSRFYHLQKLDTTFNLKTGNAHLVRLTCTVETKNCSLCCVWNVDSLTYIKMDDVPQLPPTVQKLSQNIPGRSAAVLQVVE